MAHAPGSSSSSSSSPAGFDFAAFRSVRFGSGLACPRCQGRRVHRWGFSGRRRRYRCLGCGRTFSDFTGTPLAYLKRIDRVPDYLRCLERAWPIRGTALLLGLDPCTAFRWRHRFLAHQRDTDRTALRGDVGLGLLRFPYSEKGRRHASARDRADPQTGRRRDRWQRPGDPVRALPRVLVLVAWERDGPIASGVVGRGVAEPDRVDRLLRRCLARPVRIATVEGPYGPLRRWARGAGAPVQVVPSPWLDPIGTYGRYLRRWLRRFRGVATRYLDHYLTWFALKDPAEWGVQDSWPAPRAETRGSHRRSPEQWRLRHATGRDRHQLPLLGGLARRPAPDGGYVLNPVPGPPGGGRASRPGP